MWLLQLSHLIRTLIISNNQQIKVGAVCCHFGTVRAWASLENTDNGVYHIQRLVWRGKDWNTKPDCEGNKSKCKSCQWGWDGGCQKKVPVPDRVWFWGHCIRISLSGVKWFTVQEHPASSWSRAGLVCSLPKAMRPGARCTYPQKIQFANL